MDNSNHDSSYLSLRKDILNFQMDMFKQMQEMKYELATIKHQLSMSTTFEDPKSDLENRLKSLENKVLNNDNTPQLPEVDKFDKYFSELKELFNEHADTSKRTPIRRAGAIFQSLLAKYKRLYRLICFINGTLFILLFLMALYFPMSLRGFLMAFSLISIGVYFIPIKNPPVI
ncbi:hypothetical protein DASC09_043560 [Saccharomycopsis crataegensis]|uniref:PRA1 family protein n=1 Tax=Saccharomycopsis crataegensis TaxID=43959 RepID=A0AAV5QQM4_9ASCO|nr:hypothetical protein DASC09_043560 [Saccharomycopsis crataegensis]